MPPITELIFSILGKEQDLLQSLGLLLLGYQLHKKYLKEKRN
jgi:hypothetical protein